MNYSIENPDAVIVSARIFNYERTLVYKAWTDPEHLKIWWGPEGFTNTFNEFDLRPGGRWKYVMHGPEKGNYVNEAEFITIDPPALLVWKRHTQPLFNVAASFDEAGEGKTKVTFRMIFDSVKACEKLKKYVVDKNEENFDRLEKELERMK